MKKAGIVLGILLILAFLAAALAPFMIDLNHYKGAILSRIKPYLPREVDFEHIELTVLSGLGAELRGLRVAENPAFSTGNFLELEGLQARVLILPLLKGQVRVKRIILKRPVIRVSRNAGGAFNFGDLLGGAKKPGPAGQGGPPEQGPSAQAEPAEGLGLLAGLLVKEFTMEQGKVLYQDELLWPGQRPLVIGALDVSVEDLALDRPVSVRLAADLLEEAGQNVEVVGTLGPVGEEIRPEQVPFDVRISLSRFPVGTLADLVAREIPLEVLSGRANGRLEARGSLGQQIVSQADVEIKDLRMGAGAAAKAAGSEPAVLHARLTEKAVLDVTAEKLVVESLEFSLNGDRMQMQGILQSFRQAPRWEGKVWTEGFRPELLAEILAATGRALPPELNLQGPLAARLESAGSLQEFDLEARLDLEGMMVEYTGLLQKPSGGRFSIGCKAHRKGDRLTLKDLELLLHTLALNASGEVVLSDGPRFGFLIQSSPTAMEGWEALCPPLAPYQPKGSLLLRSSLRGTPGDASLSLQVSSDRIGFVMPPPEGEGKGAGGDRSGLLESCSLKVQAKKRETAVTGEGKVEAKQGQLMGIPFQSLLASVQVRPDALDISGVEVKAFQGEVRATGRYEPAGGAWTFSPGLKDVAVAEVLDRLTQYKDVFSGSFRGQFTASGTAGEAQDVRAEGSFRIAEGELKNFDLAGSVTEALFGLKGIDQKLKSAPRKVGEHESTRFDWLEGTFEMAAGVLHLRDLQLRNVATSKTTDSDALLEGSVGLETRLVDLKGKVILSTKHSAELAEKAELMKALFNAEGRIVLPVTLKGDLQKPLPSLDTEYVLGAFSRYYARKGVQKLQEKLGLPSDAQEGEKGAGERLLQELFKKR